MTAPSDFTIDGFQGVPTRYDYRVGDVSFDRRAGTVTVEIEGRRDGDSAFVDNPEVSLFVGGEQVAGTVGTGARDFFSDVATLTAEIELTGEPTEFRYEIVAPAWAETDGTDPAQTGASWLVAVPSDPAEDLDVTCETDPTELRAAEQVTVTAEAINRGDLSLDGDVEIIFGDASETFGASFPPGERQSFSATFQPLDSGDVTPRVEWSV